MFFFFENCSTEVLFGEVATWVPFDTFPEADADKETTICLQFVVMEPEGT